MIGSHYAYGSVRIHRNFDSFGNVRSETHYAVEGEIVTAGQYGYVDEAFAYTGRFFDSATGLQNNLHRWYDASVRRWMSEDPIGFNGGDSNLYRYVGNGPTNSTDASGLHFIVGPHGEHLGADGRPLDQPPGNPAPKPKPWTPRQPPGMCIHAAPKPGSPEWLVEQEIMEEQNHEDWFMGRKDTYTIPPGAWGGVKQWEAIRQCEEVGSAQNEPLVEAY